MALVILSFLVILPLMGVSFWYPFSDADVNGNINYRSTEYLYYNEYWYEYEYIEAGGMIDFSIQTSVASLRFAISDSSFDSFYSPTGSDSYSETDMQVAPGYYEYYFVYLDDGAQISYNFISTGTLDFYVVDEAVMYLLANGYSIDETDALVLEQNTLSESGTETVNHPGDYYVVWVNNGTTSSTYEVDFTVSYTSNSVYNLNLADYHDDINPGVPLTGSYLVPRSGNWYFYIYFDPNFSPEYYTDITFDVTYKTGHTAAERWVSAIPILLVIMGIVALIVVAAVIARRGQKRLKAKEDAKVKSTQTEKTEKSKVEPKKTEAVSPEATIKKIQICARCGSENDMKSRFCVYCGGKLVGRAVKAPETVTPADSKKCSACGSKITPNDNFCKYCGTKIQH